MGTIKSKFVWHDLMTRDVAAAKRFYGEWFGWRFVAGERGYEHIFAGDTGIGGIVHFADQDGSPPFWLGYVIVDDVDATTDAAKRLGGEARVRKVTIPNVGDFAIVADPHGAVFGPFYHPKSMGMPEPNELPKPYTFCWNELLTSDPDAAARFYGALFGWGVEHVEMPGFGRYSLFKRVGVKDAEGADQDAAGMMKMPPGVPHPFWLAYVAVPDADAAVDKAKRLGAFVPMAPMDVAGVGRFATIIDPQQAAIAVLAPPK